MFEGTNDEFFFHLFDTCPHPNGYGVVIIAKVADASRQVANIQYVSGAGDDGALNDVLQLPHVARPGISLQAADEIGGDPPNDFLKIVTGILYEMIDQQIDIAMALS